MLKKFAVTIVLAILIAGFTTVLAAKNPANHYSVTFHHDSNFVVPGLFYWAEVSNISLPDGVFCEVELVGPNGSLPFFAFSTSDQNGSYGLPDDGKIGPFTGVATHCSNDLGSEGQQLSITCHVADTRINPHCGDPVAVYIKNGHMEIWLATNANPGTKFYDYDLSSALVTLYQSPALHSTQAAFYFREADGFWQVNAVHPDGKPWTFSFLLDNNFNVVEIRYDVE